MDSQNHNEKHRHHHILPTSTAIKIGICLFILTGITVWVAQINLGRMNLVIALLVASMKGTLVALFFMGLKYDKKENGAIFSTSFLFLAVFIVLTSTDLFFRGDVYVKGPLVAMAQAKSKFTKPWIATPELIAHGKELFSQNCVACHGPEGKGNGPAAAALNPPPRNFTQDAGWVNGRKPTMVFKTLKEGIKGSGMASFATLPSDDRWALAQFVLSLNPTAPGKDTPQDFAAIGVDPTKEGGGGAPEAPTIPVDFALERLAVAQDTSESTAHLYHPTLAAEAGERFHAPGAQLYQQRCAECHGDHGEGGIKVRNLGVNPVAYVTTEPFSGHAAGLQSQDSFDHIVTTGLQGNLMPGQGELTGAELKDLYQHIHELSAAR